MRRRSGDLLKQRNSIGRILSGIAIDRGQRLLLDTWRRSDEPISFHDPRECFRLQEHLCAPSIEACLWRDFLSPRIITSYHFIGAEHSGLWSWLLSNCIWTRENDFPVCVFVVGKRQGNSTKRACILSLERESS